MSSSRGSRGDAPPEEKSEGSSSERKSKRSSKSGKSSSSSSSSSRSSSKDKSGKSSKSGSSGSHPATIKSSTSRLGSEGCIQVSIRVRPLNRTEKELKNKIVWKCNDTSLQEKDDEGKVGSKHIAYDNVFSPKMNTAQVYDIMAKHIIEGSMDGYNGTIFAYGQTASVRGTTRVAGGRGEERVESGRG